MTLAAAAALAAENESLANIVTWKVEKGLEKARNKKEHVRRS